MTAALWVIAAAVVALAALAAFVVWRTFVDDGDLEVLTEDDAQRLARPYVDRLAVMAVDDAPAPDGLRLTP